MDYTAVGIHDFYVFLLIFARVGGLVVTAPLLSTPTIPSTLKAGLTLIFSLALVPLTAPLTGSVPEHLFLLAADVIKNVVFGLALGYLASLFFAAVEMAGYFVDTQMGFGLINLLNPFSERQDSVLSMFQYQLATTLYLLANGHLILLGTLAESFRLLPPSAVTLHAEFGTAILPFIQTMFVLAFRLALPAAGVLLILDIAYGLVARMVPQVNVFIVGIPGKIILGLATVILVLPIMAIIIGEINTGTLQGLRALVSAAK
jgi:flagellar biosynthetic protein FliR